MNFGSGIGIISGHQLLHYLDWPILISVDYSHFEWINIARSDTLHTTTGWTASHNDQGVIFSSLGAGFSVESHSGHREVHTEYLCHSGAFHDNYKVRVGHTGSIG